MSPARELSSPHLSSTTSCSCSLVPIQTKRFQLHLPGFASDSPLCHLTLALSFASADNRPALTRPGGDEYGSLKRIGKVLTPRRQNISHNRTDQDAPPGERRTGAAVGELSRRSR